MKEPTKTCGASGKSHNTLICTQRDSSLFSIRNGKIHKKANSPASDVIMGMKSNVYLINGSILDIQLTFFLWLGVSVSDLTSVLGGSRNLVYGGAEIDQEGAFGYINPPVVCFAHHGREPSFARVGSLFSAGVCTSIFRPAPVDGSDAQAAFERLRVFRGISRRHAPVDKPGTAAYEIAAYPLECVSWRINSL